MLHQDMSQIVNKPSPITGGLLELRSESASVEYRGETIFYDRAFYHCVDSDLDFADDELEAANLKLIYDTYRRIHDIPLAEELKAMRENYGIPASAMSLILGLGENQFGLYEEGTVPTVSVGKLLAFAMEPSNMKKMLISARSIFTEKQFIRYYNALESSLHPATYEMDGINFLDYGVIAHPFPVSETIKISKKKPSAMKASYNEYAYANAC